MVLVFDGMSFHRTVLCKGDGDAVGLRGHTVIRQPESENEFLRTVETSGGFEARVVLSEDEGYVANTKDERYYGSLTLSGTRDFLARKCKGATVIYSG